MDDDLDMLQLYLAAPGRFAVEANQPTTLMEPLMERHQEAQAAQRSTVIRITEGHAYLRAFASKSLGDIVTLVEEAAARIAAVDPNSPHYAILVAFVDQFLERNFSNTLRMIEATGVNLTAQSGDDIRIGGGGDDDDEPVDRMFGAEVWPATRPVLRPTKDKDGKTTYRVVDPSGRNG